MSVFKPAAVEVNSAPVPKHDRAYVLDICKSEVGNV
jgi:hypothetical protein